LISLYLAWLQHLAGNAFCGEQPGTGFMRKLPWWKFVLAATGATETYLNMCRFGAPFAKLTVVMHNRAWLCALGLRCKCRKPHAVRLEGSHTSKAAEYPWRLCRCVADLAARHLAADGSQEQLSRSPPPEEEVDLPRPTPSTKFHSPL